MNAPAFRLCPLCSHPASRDHDCPRRHPPVRVTRLPSAVAEATARAWDEHRPDDAASVALDALRAELRARVEGASAGRAA